MISKFKTFLVSKNPDKEQLPEKSLKHKIHSYSAWRVDAFMFVVYVPIYLFI